VSLRALELADIQRGSALGEEPRVSAAKSVWEYISEKDRERLQAFAAAAKSKAAPPPPLSMAPEPELPPERATEVVVPPLSPRTASAALQGFMPYADDAEKQERYRSYLRSQTYNTKTPFPTLLPSASVDDINKELETFSQSARVFRPMSYALSSRFTSGSTSLASSDSKVPRPGLHIYDPSKASVEFAKPQSTEVEVKQNLTPRQQAAHDGNYGPLTRVVKDFYPIKLVCRRFHVADPHPEGPPAGEKSGTATPTPTAFQGAEPMSFESQFTHQAGTEVENETPPPPTRGEGERVPTSLAEVGMADDANQGRDILTYTKPSIDIFKAIFASDDEDDEDDEPVAKVVAVVEEKPKDPFPVDEGPLDYNTFKPVFRRGGDDKKDDEGKKKKDKKKKRKGVLSFDVGDEGEEAVSFKPKKKAKPARTEDEGEWVEKVAPGQQPAAIPNPPSASAQAARSAPSSQSAALPRNSSPVRGGRKGAADFM
jgi:G patch domain-containing protein 1